MKTFKSFEIVIKDYMHLDYEDMKKILRKDFEIKIEYGKPVPIKTRLRAFGAVRDGVEAVVDYTPPSEPYKIFLIVETDE